MRKYGIYFYHIFTSSKIRISIIHSKKNISKNMTRISSFFWSKKGGFSRSKLAMKITEISIYLKVVLALDVFFRIFDRFASNLAKLWAQLETVIEKLRHEFFRQKSNVYRQFWRAAISDEPLHTKYLISQPNISKKKDKKFKFQMLKTFQTIFS